MAVAPFNWDDAVQWDGPGAIAGSEEILSADRLDRARYAEFLTNYLAAEGKQRNYVLNLNAEWGAGKTWFIKRWYMELKAHYPTVYIDAWQQDFSDDPLLTVISSIIEQLKEEAGSPQLSPYLSTKLASLLKATAPIVTKALFKKVSGINIDEVQEVITADDAGKLVESLFQDTRKKTEAVQLLKHEIQQWVEAIIGKKKKQAPAFILIDELDRCRPSYAVEMLETIKHIFDIQGVVFVLATDTEQLQHAIKVIYGDGFDAESYLGRFFHRRFTLGSISRREFIQQAISDKKLQLEHVNVWPEITDSQVLVNILTAVCDHFLLSLRKTEQVLDRTIASIVNYEGCTLNLIFLVYLFSLCEKNNEDYSAVADGKMPTTDNHPKLKGFNALTNEYGEQYFQCFIKAGSAVGNYVDASNDERFLNPFRDFEYQISLRTVLIISYDNMFNPSPDGRYSNSFNSLARECSKRMRDLTEDENALLAEKELLQLERRLVTYKNLVELAVHLE